MTPRLTLPAPVGVLSHLLPYADWTPGRYAVRFSNLTQKEK